MTIDAGNWFEVLRSQPWGELGAPEDFEYPENPVRTLSVGAIVTFRLPGIGREFYAVVGPFCEYMRAAKAGRFLYLLKTKPSESIKRLTAHDLLLMPVRIQRTPKTFSPKGFPFVDTGEVVPSGALFTGHPTDEPFISEASQSIEGPHGPNPSPKVGLGIADCTLAFGIGVAHLMEHSDFSLIPQP